MIRDYTEFIDSLLKTGFSGAIGGKDEGVFGLFRYGWGAEDETGIAFDSCTILWYGQRAVHKDMRGSLCSS